MSSDHPMTNQLATTRWLWWRRRTHISATPQTPQTRTTCKLSLLTTATATTLLLILTLANKLQAQQLQNNGNPNALIVPVSNSRTVSAHLAVNLHEPRIELRYQSKNRIVNLNESSPNNTVVAIVSVFDEDTGPNGETIVAIESGNELGHFKLVVTSYSTTVQVNGAPLSRAQVSDYNLTLVARDRGQPPKMSAVNLVIKLISSPPAHSPLEPLPSSKPPVSDLMYVGTMLVVIFSALIFLIIIGCALVQRPRSKKPPLPPPHNNPASAGGPTQRTTWSGPQLGLANLTNHRPPA